MTNIADDPSQWTSKPDERTVPGSGEPKPEPSPTLQFIAHDMMDYHRLRIALAWIVVNGGSSTAKHAKLALDGTPKDGCHV